MDKTNLVIDTLAFEGDKCGYHFKATYLSEPKGDALVEISKGGVIVREFLWPAYKIWNIAAHAEDIAAGLDAGNASGLYMAGEVGFGGNVYSEQPQVADAVEPVGEQVTEGPRATSLSSVSSPSTSGEQ